MKKINHGILLWLGLAVAWCALIAVAGHYALNFFARWMAARDGFVAKYRIVFLVNWKTMLLLMLLAAVVVFARMTVHAASGRGAPRRWSCAALAALALTVLTAQVRSYLNETSWGSNRWGFSQNWGPNQTFSGIKYFDGFPLVTVVTNSQGYRDDWELPPKEDGTIRVLLVGDSHVFGAGIPDKSGMLDAQMERRLNAGGAAKWDVWNIANHPAALWYYTEAIMRIAPEARPRYAVLSVFPDDIAFEDEQKALADKPAWFYSLAKRVGLLQDLLWMAHHIWWPGNTFDIMSDPAVVAENKAAFERLLAFAGARRLPLVIWEALGPVKFFDPYRGRPGLTFVDWCSQVGRPGPCTPWSEWGHDPALAFPDGHPLPKTNGIIADVIARVLTRLEAESQPKTSKAKAAR